MLLAEVSASDAVGVCVWGGATKYKLHRHSKCQHATVYSLIHLVTGAHLKMMNK